MIRSGCGGGTINSEMRVTVGLPWSLQPYDVWPYEYMATATWADQAYIVGSKNEFTVDNYWHRPSDVTTVRRDYMNKVCYSFNSVALPGGVNYSCLSPAP